MNKLNTYKGMQITVTRRKELLFLPFPLKNLLIMKLVIVLLIATGLQVTAKPSEAQKVSLSGKSLSLSTVFKEIRKQTNYQFFYKSEYLKSAKPVDINVKNVNVKRALDVCFKGQPLTYALVGTTIVVKEKNKDNKSLQRQRADTSYLIKGRVFTDKEPPQTLPGVVVRVKGTQRGTTTDADGHFSIKANKNEVLTFSLVGYHSVDQLILKQYRDLVISLEEKVSALNQMTVVGMTDMEKTHIASSVATLDVEANIEGRPITSLSQALQGGITGIQAGQYSGMPGSDESIIKIRGISTLGNSDPLVLVDGVPMNMNHINPSTVKSVTILKDAAAAAIYGARAANGVILITTKRGKAGKVSIDYNGYYGVQSPTIMPDFVDAPTYMRMYNIAQLNSGGQPFYTKEDIRKTISGEDPIQYPNTDWAKEMINQAAPITDHSISVTGGNQLARFAVTGEFMSQDGMIPVLSKERFNIRANTSITVNNKFYFYLDILAIKQNGTFPNKALGHGGTYILDDMYKMPPTILPKYPKEKGWPTIYGRYKDIVNPIAYFEQGGYQKKEFEQSSFNLRPRWEVFPNFNLKGQFSFRLSSELYHARKENFYFFDYYTKQLAQTWKVQLNTHPLRRDFYYYLGGTADYTWDHDGHHIFALGGYSQEMHRDQDWSTYSIASFFSKINYSFNDKYLLEAAIRTDGSSRFGPGRKFGVFPSIAVGWNLQNENFLKNSKLINNLKIRASYGQLGNENVGLYKYQTLINAGTGTETSWGNPGITWETVNMLDIGTDIGLFHDSKLNITFDYYDKLTTGIILYPPVSLVGGMGSPPINAGKLRNKGWELSLKYYAKTGKNTMFSFHSGLTYNKNKILSLEGGPYIGNGDINKVGHSINSFYGYRTDGLLQVSDFDKIGKPKVPIVNGEDPGDIRYLDLDNDGIIDDNDKRVIGDPVPRFNYFVNLKFTWKNFSLETLLQGVGKSIYSADMHGNAETGYIYHPLNSSSDGGIPTNYYAANTWRRNHTNARFPRLSAIPSVNLFDSDFWNFDAAYLRIKYAQLSYNLNLSFLHQKGLQKVKLYITAQNPLTLTSLVLVDPESRGGPKTYGIMKMYVIGLHFKL